MNNIPLYPYYDYYNRRTSYFPKRKFHSLYPIDFPSYPKDEKFSQEKFLSDEFKEEPIFEILGVQLYYDDVLLICLIFFLYLEGIKDYYLFLVLILILLT